MHGMYGLQTTEQLSHYHIDYKMSKMNYTNVEDIQILGFFLHNLKTHQTNVGVVFIADG